MSAKQSVVGSSDYVRSVEQTAEILGVSVRTLRRMQLRGDAPRRIRISDRRYGFRDSEISQFLASRAEA